MIVRRIQYILVRWKAFLIRLAVEETHRVPFAPDMAQTRRGEWQRVAGNSLNHHMSREGDVVVCALGDRDDGVKELAASFHLRL